MSKATKPTDTELSEYLRLDAAIKGLENARDTIKAKIKAFGPFESNAFNVTFTSVEQNRVVDAGTLLEALGPVKVTELQLIKTSSYDKIGVKRKEVGIKKAS